MPRSLNGSMKKTGGFFRNVIENLRSSSGGGSQSSDGSGAVGGSDSSPNIPALAVAGGGSGGDSTPLEDDQQRIGEALTPSGSSSYTHTALAFDPVHRLIAIGTRSGALRM